MNLFLIIVKIYLIIGVCLAVLNYIGTATLNDCKMKNYDFVLGTDSYESWRVSNIVKTVILSGIMCIFAWPYAIYITGKAVILLCDELSNRAIDDEELTKLREENEN